MRILVGIPTKEHDEHEALVGESKKERGFSAVKL